MMLTEQTCQNLPKRVEARLKYAQTPEGKDAARKADASDLEVGEQLVVDYDNDTKILLNPDATYEFTFFPPDAGG
jgi:hypothetical protein